MYVGGGGLTGEGSRGGGEGVVRGEPIHCWCSAQFEKSQGIGVFLVLLFWLVVLFLFLFVCPGVLFVCLFVYWDFFFFGGGVWGGGKCTSGGVGVKGWVNPFDEHWNDDWCSCVAVTCS